MFLYEKLKNSSDPLKDYGDIMKKVTHEQRILLNCMFEITPVCNFKCSFCYARLSKEELEAKGERILGFDFWKRLIDELCDNGLFDLSISGGECTLHPDFCRIYEYAYDKNLQLSIMTNGSGLNDDILELFKKKPPYCLFITVYGDSPQTYDKVCKNAAAYEIVRCNIDVLKKMKMPVVIQFTACKDNVGDLEKVYAYSKQIGYPFRYTSELSGFGSCSFETLEDNCVESGEFVNIARRIWLDQRGITSEEIDERPLMSVSVVPEKKLSKKGMTCGAGRSSCHINYKGEMQACVAFEAFKTDTKNKPIAECWKEIVDFSDEIPRLAECLECIHLPRCKQCLAAHYNDTKEFGKPSPRFCWKKLYPEKAKKVEEQYEKNHYITLKDNKDI